MVTGSIPPPQGSVCLLYHIAFSFFFSISTLYIAVSLLKTSFYSTHRIFTLLLLTPTVLSCIAFSLHFQKLNVFSYLLSARRARTSILKTYLKKPHLKKYSYFKKPCFKNTLFKILKKPLGPY